MKPESFQGPSTPAAQRGLVAYVARSPAICGCLAAPLLSVSKVHTAVQALMRALLGSAAVADVTPQPPEPALAVSEVTSQASANGSIWESSLYWNQFVL